MLNTQIDQLGGFIGRHMFDPYPHYGFDLAALFFPSSEFREPFRPIPAIFAGATIVLFPRGLFPERCVQSSVQGPRNRCNHVCVCWPHVILKFHLRGWITIPGFPSKGKWNLTGWFCPPRPSPSIGQGFGQICKNQEHWVFHF